MFCKCSDLHSSLEPLRESLTSPLMCVLDDPDPTTLDTGEWCSLLFLGAIYGLYSSCLPRVTPTLPNHTHPRNFLQNKFIVEKYCYYGLERCKGHYLVKKSNDYIINFCQCFSLKLGVIGQVGGCIWAANSRSHRSFAED